jgi:hypothetical protein
MKKTSNPEPSKFIPCPNCGTEVKVTGIVLECPFCGDLSSLTGGPGASTTSVRHDTRVAVGGSV